MEIKKTSDNGVKVITDNVSVMCDAYSSTSDYNFISHAHADHAVKNGASNIVCSEPTKQICEKRYNTEYTRTETDRIEMIDSGHILGSRAALIDGKVLYTGDICTAKRAFLEGVSDLPRAKHLVIETTYGSPEYIFPEQQEIRENIEVFLKNTEQPKFLFGYSLGKAQKIHSIVQETGDFNIVTHGSVESMNKIYNETTELSLNATPYSDFNGDIDESTVFIFPPNTSKADYVENLVDRSNGVKAGFSGWGSDESYKFRGGYDRVFKLSDHADFQGLNKIVNMCKPDEIYTTHGFSEKFARHQAKKRDVSSRALKSGQSNLSSF